MASGMEAPRSMAEVVVVLSSREQTNTSGSQSAKLRYLWVKFTAMTAEEEVVCVLTGILDLVLGKKPSMEKINQCIDAFLKSH